jgi:NAD(P)-dependent dehydrogenase (short-subunit alcohol dehydrogenase family)
MPAHVAIVTGTSRGVGLGTTRALLERGYLVVANSRTITDRKDLRPSASLVLVDGDMGKQETATKVADAAVKHFGRIDLLVNNVGIYVPRPFTEYTPEDFERMVGTNVAGYFFVTQQAVAHMRKQKSGHVVAISTTVTDQPLAGAPHLAAGPHRIHGSGIQPRPGDGVRGRRDRGQHDLARCRRHADARQRRSRGVEETPSHSHAWCRSPRLWMLCSTWSRRRW